MSPLRRRVRPATDQHQAQATPQRPGEPSGGAGAHPTDSSILFPCSFCHNHHSTALPSPKRYDKRYEEKFLRDIRPHQRPTRDMGSGPEDMEGGHKLSHQLQ